MPEPAAVTPRTITSRVRRTLLEIQVGGFPLFEERVYLAVPPPGAARPRAVYTVENVQGYDQSNGVTIVAEIAIMLSLQCDDAEELQGILEAVQSAFDSSEFPPMLEGIEIDELPVNDDDALWVAEVRYKFRR